MNQKYTVLFLVFLVAAVQANTDNVSQDLTFEQLDSGWVRRVVTKYCIVDFWLRLKQSQGQSLIMARAVNDVVDVLTGPV